VILAVKEIDLIRQLADGLLVGLMGVLHAEHLQRLAALVELLKAFDFFLTNVDLLLGKLKFILDF
jgi:hypothetical protein